MPIPLRQPLDDKALYFPRWECFCCHDSGIVPDHLVHKVPGYEDYNCRVHKNVLCTCVASTRFSGLRDAFDSGLTREWRENLHDFNYQGWLETNKAIANGDKTRDQLMGTINSFSQVIGF